MRLPETGAQRDGIPPSDGDILQALTGSWFGEIGEQGMTYGPLNFPVRALLDLTLRKDHKGLIGTLTLNPLMYGQAPSPNPKVAYPEALTACVAKHGATGSCKEMVDTFFCKGCVIPLHEIKTPGTYLTARASRGEQWKSWCAGQPVYSRKLGSGKTESNCLPDWLGGGQENGRCFYKKSPTSAREYFDCGKKMLCGPICQCNTTACSAKTPLDMTLELAHNGLVGKGGDPSIIGITILFGGYKAKTRFSRFQF